MSEIKRPKVCPVGTVRHWDKGDVIKLHEGNKFHNGWYNVLNSPALEEIANTLDRLARSFTQIAQPVSGETFLDEVIKNYKRTEGEENGPFSPQDFKQYAGYYGNLTYSFRSELMKRAMAIHREMNLAIQEALLEEAGDGELSDDRKAQIRSYIRAQYKNKLAGNVDLSEFKQLKNVIQGQYSFLQKTSKLSAEDKVVVDFIQNELDALQNGKLKGVDYFSVVDKVADIKRLIIDKFNNNWLLLQTQLDFVDSRFQNYLKLYSEDISQVIKDYSLKFFNMNIEDEPDKFYSELESKILGSSVNTLPDVNKYFSGSFSIQTPDGKHGHIHVNVEDVKNEAYPSMPFGADGQKVIVMFDDENFIKDITPYLSAFKNVKNDNGKIQLELIENIEKIKNTLPENVSREARSLTNLLSLTGRIQKPDTTALGAYKKAYILGKDITSFYKGHKLSFKIGYDVEMKYAAKIANATKPVIHLDNVEDAKIIKSNFMNKFMEVGFNIEEAEKEFQSYVDNNKFPLEHYDLKIIMTDLENNNVFDKAKIDFKPLLQMRFNSKYQKNLSGDWNPSNIKSLATIENVIDQLPQGHIKTNNALKEFMYDSDYNKSYAFYNSDLKRIQFSNDCLRSTSKQTKMDGSSHFKCTVVHEIGHAVSQKLKRHQSIEYRNFANECGWSYKEEKTFDHSTGSDIRIPRTGKNSYIQLITDYAHQAPEEAFAEYYSFYHVNKPIIDSWLSMGNDEMLKQNSLVIPKREKYSTQHITLGSDLTFPNLEKVLTAMPKAVEKLKTEFIRSNFKRELDLQFEPINSWAVRFKRSYETEVTKSIIHAGRDNENCSPVFLIKNENETYDVLPFEGNRTANIIEANRYLQRQTPAVVISRRAFDKLQENAPNEMIGAMLLNEFKEQNIPAAQKNVIHNEKIEGLQFDAKVIDVNVIKKNRSALMQMKKMYESDELKKALDELFDNQTSENLAGKFLQGVTQFFQPFTDAIKDVVKHAKKCKETETIKTYADVIIITYSMKILFCLRNKEDDFMAGKLCLPGGKVEKDEPIMNAAIREVVEETNIRLDKNRLVFIQPIKNVDESTSNYFAYLITENELNEQLVLDANEQSNYFLIPASDILNAALPKEKFILDLQARVKHLIENFDVIERIFEPVNRMTQPLDNDIEFNSQFEALGYLSDQFNHGEIDDDTFIQTLIDNKEWLV